MDRKKQKKITTILGKIILFLVFGCMIVGGIYGAVYEHDYTVFGFLAFYGVILLLAFIYEKSSKDYKRLMCALPADYKLLTRHVSVIDIGNFRFTYHIYGKGGTFSMSDKTYLSMSVQIPFLGDDKDTKDAIRNDLISLIESLHEEGVLTDAGVIFQDESDVNDNNDTNDENNNQDEDNGFTPKWIGQPFWVEFLNKNISSDWLIALQNKVIGIINKYNLQDYEYCTISGTSSGSTYRLYKGNLLQSSIQKDAFGDTSYRYSYKEPCTMLLYEYDSMYSVEDYNKLYDMSIDNNSDIAFDDIEKIIKRMFKKSGTKIVVKLTNEDNGICANITIPKLASASSYHLTFESDRWWIYADGKLDNIDPISIEDENTACNFYLGIINKFTQN